MLYFSDAFVVERPRLVLAKEGENVELPCDTSGQINVQWKYHGNSDESTPLNISSQGRILGTFRDRFVLGQPEIHFNYLYISKTQTSDTGMYCCEENDGAGPFHYIFLTVAGRYADYVPIPTCYGCCHFYHGLFAY